jgi:hypothetical protein
MARPATAALECHVPITRTKWHDRIRVSALRAAAIASATIHASADADADYPIATVALVAWTAWRWPLAITELCARQNRRPATDNSLRWFDSRRRWCETCLALGAGRGAAALRSEVRLSAAGVSQIGWRVRG